MSAAGDHKGHSSCLERACGGPDEFALQIDVEDGKVKAASLALPQGIRQIVAAGMNAMAQRFEEILEHHGDQRLVFDDENGAALFHSVADTKLARGRNYFQRVASTLRAASDSS